jgi:hypothetical protein
MVLSDEGTYRLYDLSNPSQYTQYTLGAEVAEMGIVSAKAYDDGFVVLTGGLQFLEVRGWRGGRVSALAPSGECGSDRSGQERGVAIRLIRCRAQGAASRLGGHPP